MLWLLVFLVFACLVSAHAAPSPLSADVTPLSLRPRTSAPAYIDVKLHSQSRSPLQGTLEVQSWSAAEMVSHQEIADLTLFSGTAVQRLLLPPPASAASGRTVEEVRLRFRTGGAAYDLGRFRITGENVAARQFVIGLYRPAFGLGEPQNLTWRALRPERVLPEDRSHVVSVATSPVWFTPEDLPSAMGLCVLDLLVLEGPALASLSEKQLADLAAWVEAGGSLCLVAVRDLKAEHQAFLRRLSVADDDATAKPPSPLFRRVGLGRVAWIEAAPTGEDQLMAEPWTTATRYLAHVDASYRPADAEDRSRNRSSSWYYEQEIQNALQQMMLGALPRTARMIPLPVLGAILGAFILLVGPGEWILLGKLRRRRWTWATFPVIAVGCALVTVRAAEHYLGVGDQRVSMVVTDYTPQGGALRENRFDLWFAGRNKDAVVEKRQALSVSCLGRNFGNRNGSLKQPIYEGRVPTHYALRQALFQWVPYIQRTLTFAPTATAPRLRWEAIREPLDHSVNKSAADDPNTATFVSEKIGAQGWSVHVFHPARARSKVPLFAELLSLNNPNAWAFARSPSGEADLADLALDHEQTDMLVVAQRQVGQEIQIQRCVYHFDSHE